MAGIRIGILVDFPVGADAKRVMLDALNLAFEEAQQQHLIDRPVELILREALGIPSGGTMIDLIKAWEELKNEGAIGIYGPSLGENVIGIRGFIESQGHVPTLSMTGTDRWCGEWCFMINNGSIPEDPYLMTNYLGIHGKKTVVVVYDRAATGEEYRTYFREACEFDGLEIVGEVGIDVNGRDDMLAAAKRLQSARADAVAYLGIGISAPFLNQALAELKWNPVRVMPSGFMTAQFTPQGLGSIKGWIGIDQYDETNEVGHAVINRFEKRYGYRPANMWMLINYDFAHVIARGLSKAYPLTPEGFKAGLEHVKMIPAANGGPRSYMSFGPYVRRAWLTPDYIVMREVDPNLRGDENVILGGPGTVFRHRFTPRAR